MQAVRLVSAFLLAATMSAGPALGKDFAFDEKANQEMARRLKIPVYFAVPNSARAALPKSIETSDRLIDFKHPDATGRDVGLRLVVAKRAGLAQRLGKSGEAQAAIPTCRWASATPASPTSRTGCCTTSTTP
jgi:hypothetical protein